MAVLAIVAAAVAGLVISGAWYAVVPVGVPATGPEHARAAGPSAGMQAAVEVCRSAAVAGLVAGIVTVAGWGGPGEGLLLGLALWVLPVVLLAGAVVHEGAPPRAALVHAGDWLLKLLAIGAIVGALA